MSWYRFLKLAASDAKINFLAQRYKLPVEKVKEIVPYDISGRGVFLEWLVKQVTLKQLRFPEDAQKVQERLTQFSKLKNSPKFTAAKDINQYKTFGDLAETIDAASGEVSKKEQFRVESEKGVEVVSNKPPFTVLMITTPEASAKWCKGTEWCVKDPEYFKHYDMGPDSPLYLFLKDGQKYALFHAGSKQLMDPYDRPLDLDHTMELVPAVEGSGRLARTYAAYCISDEVGLDDEIKHSTDPDIKNAISFKDIRDGEYVDKVIAQNPAVVTDEAGWKEIVNEAFGYHYLGRILQNLAKAYKQNIAPELNNAINEQFTTTLAKLFNRSSDTLQIRLLLLTLDQFTEFGQNFMDEITRTLINVASDRPTILASLSPESAYLLRKHIGSPHMKKMLEDCLKNGNYVGGYIEAAVRAELHGDELTPAIEPLKKLLIGITEGLSPSTRVLAPQRFSYLDRFEHMASYIFNETGNRSVWDTFAQVKSWIGEMFLWEDDDFEKLRPSEVPLPNFVPFSPQYKPVVNQYPEPHWLR